MTNFLASLVPSTAPTVTPLKLGRGGDISVASSFIEVASGRGKCGKGGGTIDDFLRLLWSFSSFRELTGSCLFSEYDSTCGIIMFSDSDSVMILGGEDSNFRLPVNINIANIDNNTTPPAI